MKTHKVIMCKYCGRHSVTQSSITFKCSYCNKTCKMLKENEAGIAVNIKYQTDSGSMASKVCAELNLPKWIFY